MRRRGTGDDQAGLTVVPTLSVMIPTIGRPTLARTLASIRSQQFVVGDEVLLLADGIQDTTRELWEQFKFHGRYLEHAAGPSNDWGHTPRNLFMPEARGTHIVCLDDDDVMTPGALVVIRAALAEAPDRPHMFRGDFSGVKLATVWKEKTVVEGNVSTVLFVIPTAGKKFGRYTPRYGGDYDFCASTLRLYPPGALVWREEIICTIRPQIK